VTIKHTTIPAANSKNAVGYAEWSEDHTITGDVAVPGKLTVYTGQDGGYHDILGQLVPPPASAGTAVPTYTQFDTGSPFWGWAFAVNDYINIVYHIPHQYASAGGTAPTPIYLHAHWTTNGTSENSVKWEWYYTFARGFNQTTAGEFSVTGTQVTAEEAASGTAWRHMTTEISTPISNANFEVDGLILARLRRVTNGGSENGDTVFLMIADAHIQIDTHSTKNRTPDFYT